MDDQYQRPYLDSSVFIAWIKGEIVGTIDRKDVANHIFYLATQNHFQIFTSAVTLAEVHKIKGNPNSLRPDQDENLLKFFESEFILIIEVDREIGERANQFCRDYGLLPMDALHLACALRANCDVLLAWDSHFKNVNHPMIRCEQPRIVGQTRLTD